MMDEHFEPDELLFRAVRPDNMYWKVPGEKLSSAAFKDSHGLSVDRAGGRTIAESAECLKTRMEGTIAYLPVSKCNDVNAIVKYLPIPNINIWHSEIYGSSNNNLALTSSQAKKIADAAKLYIPPMASDKSPENE